MRSKPELGVIALFIRWLQSHFPSFGRIQGLFESHQPVCHRVTAPVPSLILSLSLSFSGAMGVLVSSLSLTQCSSLLWCTVGDDKDGVIDSTLKNVRFQE